MSRKRELFQRLTTECIVGVVREDSVQDALNVARTLVEHGIRLLEITFTTPDAASILEELRKELGSDIALAAGTVRSPNDAAEARRAGAVMLVSPHTDVRLIEYGAEHDMLVIAGAATATEIIGAWEAGADVVKVYPAPFLGGADFIRTIRQPIRDVPLLAGGPITLDTVEDYLDAGAVAVNLGASLALPELVQRHDWEEIGRRTLLATSIIRSMNDESRRLVH